MSGWQYLQSTKHGGRCKTCGEFVPAGSQAYWLGRVGLKHPACYEKDAAGAHGASGERDGEYRDSEGENEGSGRGKPYGDAEAGDCEGGDPAGTPRKAPRGDASGSEGDDEADGEYGDERDWEREQGNREAEQEEAERGTPPNPYSRPNSKQAILWEHFNEGGDQTSARRTFGPKVGSETPWIFTRNTGKGYREPAPMSEQAEKFTRVVEDTYRQWLEAGGKRDETPKPEPTPEPTPDAEAENEAEQEEAETPEPEPEPLPEPTPKHADVWEFVRRVNEIRDRLNARALHEASVDELGMRITKDGARAIGEGLPMNAMLSAIGLHWSPELRRDMGLPDYDPETFGQDEKIPMMHRVTPYVLRLVRARVPVFLVGGTGNGKSHLARQVAALLGLDFGECSLSGGISVSSIFGNWSPAGYIGRPFPTLYETGGVMLLDELDAADPNALLAVNNALANDRLQNPQTGQLIERHPDFVIIAAGNTFGTSGARRDFTAREKLDAATIDRFRMGRVKFNLDRELEREMLSAMLGEGE